MDLGRLEKYKTQFKYFQLTIGDLQTYLNKKSKSPIKVVSPYEVSKILAVPELDAIFLLSLAEKEDLVHKKFLVFTKKEHSLIGEFDNNDEIPSEIENAETGKPVEEEDFYIDIIFEIPNA